MRRFRIDPATGWDYDPKFARWRRRFGWVLLVIVYSTSGRLVRAHPVVGIVIGGALVALLCALVLTRGLQARSLALRVGEDTRLARQLRWEQVVGLAIGGLFFGVALCFAAWGVSSVGLGVLLGLAGASLLACTVTGLWLAWRHRPVSLGLTELPSVPQNR